MSYADDGVGAPVLLVHGWAGHGGFFQDLSKRLSRTNRVLTLTLRGHPGSDQGQAPCTIETLADDIIHFIEALDLKGLVALGWSMGAMALWAAAAKLGPRLSGLIVEDMAPRLVNDESWAYGISGNYAEADVEATLSDIRSDWPAHVARFAPRMFARNADANQIAWAAAEMSKVDPEAMASFWASMASQDFRGALARITQPMLVIGGAESQVYPDRATEFVAHTAPKGERVVISGAGHVPHLEAPDAFFNHVEAFVRAQRRPEIKSGGVGP